MGGLYSRMIFDWAARLLYLGVALECARHVRSGWSLRGVRAEAAPERFEAARREIAAAREQARWLLIAVFFVDVVRSRRYLPLFACGLGQTIAYAYASLAAGSLTWRQIRAVARIAGWAALTFAGMAVFYLVPAGLAFLSFDSEFAAPIAMIAVVVLAGAIWTLYALGETWRAGGESVSSAELQNKYAAICGELGLVPAKLCWLPASARLADSSLAGVRVDLLKIRPVLLLGREFLEELSPAEIELVLRYAAARDYLGLNARPLARYWAFCLAVFAPGLLLTTVLFASFARWYDPFDLTVPALGLFLAVAAVLDALEQKRMEYFETDAFLLDRFGADPAALISLLGRIYAVHGHPLKGLDDIKSSDTWTRIELLGRYAKREITPAQWSASLERRALLYRTALACGLGILFAAAAAGCVRAHRLPSAIRRGDQAGVESLISRGAELNREDLLMGGKTPVMVAAEEGNLRALQRLLLAGAWPDPRDRGDSALLLAVRTGHADAARVLLYYKGNPYRAGRAGATPAAEARGLGRRDLLALFEAGK
jgi:hypothetical protein